MILTSRSYESNPETPQVLMNVTIDFVRPPTIFPVPVRISISLCLTATRSVFQGQATISLPRPVRPNHSVARYYLNGAEQDASKRDVFWGWRQKQST